MGDEGSVRKRSESRVKAALSPLSHVIFSSVKTIFIAHPIQKDDKTFCPIRPPQATWFS